MTTDAYAIPKWFVQVCTGVLALSVPWAGWVTITLATIGVQVEQQGELRERIDRVESRLTDYILSDRVSASSNEGG